MTRRSAVRVEERRGRLRTAKTLRQRLFLGWLALLVSACLGRMNEARPLSARDLERHDGLAAHDHEGRAQLALDLGLASDASHHASQWLLESLARARIAEATSVDRRTQAELDRTLRRAAQLASEVGRRFDEGALVIDAALAHETPNTRDLAWGCEHADNWYGDAERLLASLKGNPNAWLSGWQLVHEWHDVDVDTALAISPKLDVRGNDLRWTLLLKELESDTPTQRTVELAAAIAEHDPSDLRARVLLELREASRSGAMVFDTDLLRDQTSWHVSVSALSRARRRAETYADAPAARLHYASILLRRGLSGDAIRALGSTTWASDDQRDVAELIAALAEVRTGAAEAYDTWRNKHDRAPSLAADRSLESWSWRFAGRMPPNDTTLGHAFSDALRRRVAVRDTELSDDQLALAWALGLRARRDRRWVRERLGHAIFAVDACLERGGSATACASTPRHWQHAIWALDTLGLTPDTEFLLAWLSPGQLDEDTWALLESSRSSHVALSSTFTSLYVSGLIARGRFDDATRWLERFGQSLPRLEEAGLQLTLHDQLAGRATSNPESIVDHWPPRSTRYEAFPQQDNPDAPWAERIDRAYLHISEGRLSAAETIFVALSNDAPEPARSVMLRFAATAAFEAGRPADAAVHLTEVQDSPAVTELRARITAARGKVAQGREALLEVWPVRPTAGLHALRLGVSMQTQPALDAFAGHAGLDWRVENAVRAGSITTLSSLARMQAAADDAEAAWNDADGLVPELVSAALHAGSERLQNASSPSEARPIAARMLDLHRRTRHPSQEAIMELMLLTGEHQAALSSARTTQPNAGRPLPSSHPLLRLHEAAAAGLLDQNALWHEWRWRANLGDEQQHGELLAHASGPLLGYACTFLAETPAHPDALPTCKRAWQAEKHDGWESAVNYSYLLLQQDVPPPGKLAVIFESTPPPPYNATEARPRDSEDLALFHQNFSVWLALGGEHERAAQARIESFALADFEDLQENAVPELQYATRPEHAHAGTVANYQLDGHLRFARTAYQSLVALQPDKAIHYAKVAVAVAAEDDDVSALLIADRSRALAPLLAADLTDGVPHEVLSRAISLGFESDTTGQLRTFFDEHPDSQLVALLVAESDIRAGRVDEARRGLRRLDHAADNPLVAIVEARARLALEDTEGARARIATALASNPNSLLLTHLALPESVVGPRPGVPAWARSEDAYDQRLAAVSHADMLARMPRYRAHTEVGADAFFPLDWELGDSPLSAHTEYGAQLSVTHEARAARCVGEDCLRDSLDALRRDGYTQHFLRTTTLPAGDATEVILSNATRVWMVASVPAGGRVFTLLGSAPHEHAESLVNAFAVLRLSFAPLDAVVPAFSAASLRADGPKLVDRVRLKARLEASAASTSECPAPSTLAELSSSAASEVLLDLYLAARHSHDRARVLLCTGSEGPAARRVALPALLDDDAALHAWGRDAVHRHASRALHDAKHLLPMGIPLSAPDYFERENDAPRGRIELGLALPGPRARRFVTDLQHSTSHDARVDGWVIASMSPALLDEAAAVDAARSDDVAIAFLALLALDRAESPRYAEALRRRAEALEVHALDKTDLWQVRALAFRLAKLDMPTDGARIRALATELNSGDQRQAKTQLERLATSVSKPPPAIPKDSADVVRAHRRRAKASTRPRSREQLATASLAELLPTRHWTFARVASPGLFASTVLDLGRRLDPDDPTQRLLVDRAVESFRKSSGFDALLETGGLDLTAPVECATMAGDDSFVCSATVNDQDALLSELARREHGSDAGLAIVLKLSESIGLLPPGLGALPVVLHTFVYDEPDNDDTPQPEPSSHRYQRLRSPIRMGGYPLEVHAVIDAEDDYVSVDAERYLFVENRVFVFGTDLMAQTVLFEPADGISSLAEDPEFRALTAEWKDGSALQAAAMGLSSPVEGTSVASEVVADGTGLAFRYSATTESNIVNMRRAEARLPPGAVSTLVIGYPEQNDDVPELPERDLADGDTLPPLALVTASQGAAFGWYPAPGDGLWKQWVLALPHGRLLRRAARKAGVRRPSSTPRQSKAGWWWAERDGQLIVASNEHLAQLAVDRPVTTDRGAVLLGRGTFRGSAAADVVERLPATASGIDRTFLRFAGGVVGLVDSVQFDATWDPSTKVGTMAGRVNLRLRTRDSSDVIDQWLAAARFRNAATLPRSLGAREAEGTLRFTLAVSDADAFAERSVFPSARVSTRVIDAEHLELTVHAKAPTSAGAKVLDPKREKALLETSSALRIHDPEIEKIRDTLVRDSMNATEKARAISSWVHERISYEVTPRPLDATEILEVGRGDCSEYAQLTVALLRSAGVAAEVRSGMAAQGSDMVAHAWVAYHDGQRWHEIDPTWGRMRVTAGHLPLEVNDVLALISLGQLEVQAIEVVKNAN